ncbi:MAG TPA: DUF167 domain-containing protein [Candidatus Binatia bacterium]|jgi:uncharacterized protein YggU (UPF0235/DUF167 family)|nr:DUF167 domain-containing protein [Candidatus Binatia bacterium]
MAGRLINVRVHARARERSVTQRPDGTYVVRTTAVAEKGKANEDVVDMLSSYLNIPRSLIVLVRGGASPKKVFKIMA